VPVDGRVETGNPVDVICRRAREIDADLIVMTSHGRTGLSRMWLGSVADGVMREASVPVLMLRPMDEKHDRQNDAPLFRRILVPLDGSPASSAILAAAGDMARASGGTLVLVRVITPIPLLAFGEGLSMYPTAVVDEDATEQVADTAREELAAVARSLERDGLKVETDVVIGKRIASELLAMAESKSADLIAITTHGRGASRLVVGSVADKILRGSHLPLLLLHPQAAARANTAHGRPMRATA
jgi:nucleotide-binding universal stress UspA family protein